MPVTMLTTRDAAHQMREAYQSNDPERIEQAWEAMQRSIATGVCEQMRGEADWFRAHQDDSAVLASRGYRRLTSQETRWYERVIDALRSDAPKEAFTSIIGTGSEEDLMPTTIIEDVYRRLTEEHPLLSRLDVQRTGYLTKWIMNKHSRQKAVWGNITAAVTEEITSSFQVVDIKQSKLSCYVVIELGMLDLGPTFLDNYIRTCMLEASACGLESAVICGTGINMPVGMDRDLGASSYNTSTGWAQKTPVKVSSFAPAEYGALVAKLVTDENGKRRTFSQATLICSMSDYLTKIMPATSLLTASGVYARDLFPFPTETVVSEFCEDGKPILGLPEEYMLAMGTAPRSGVITYDDSVKFLEDQRVLKLIEYADGRAVDNTSFILLDISELEPAYLTVKNVGAAAAASA